MLIRQITEQSHLDRKRAAEFDKMKIHPIVGAEILEHVRFPYPVVPIVRSHHEKWDGNGYPDGLKGDAIPTGARILAAVDCLDALASDRQYRRAIPLDDALALLRQTSASPTGLVDWSAPIVQPIYRASLQAAGGNQGAPGPDEEIERLVRHGTLLGA